MAQPAINIRNLRDVSRNLAKLGADAGDLKAAMRKAGTIVADDAKAGAPTRSGRLAGSVRPGAAARSAVVRVGGARVPYAGVIHYGGYNGITAQPFLLDSLERKQPQAVEAIDADLRAIIRKLNLNP